VWKYLAESVTGTAHVRGGLPCQDSCLASVVDTGEGTVLVLACADGAGSAAHADRGAGLACDTIERVVRADLEDGQTVANIDRDALLYWLGKVRADLDSEAKQLGVRVRELACTLLVAVVGESAAAFAQVGDGAVVVAEGARFRPVFWPAGGEYANETTFLTGDGFEKAVEFASLPTRIDELALFTDGLQRLALDFTARDGHPGFFRPLFQRLRDADDHARLSGPLREFLNSDRVNQRSDDDKTLILATRVTAGAPATNPL
jgi:hypothetical protein